MSSPEELLQQVRDGTLSAQEFTNQFFSLKANVATYGHLIDEAYSIQEKRLTIEKEKEKAEAVAEAVKTTSKAKTPKKEKDL